MVNIESRRRTNRDYSAKRYLTFRRDVDAIKLSSGCVDCGYNNHPAALHFDHIDPSTKKFKIADSNCRSWRSVLLEIAKCVVRCANCHAIKTVVKRECGRDKISYGVLGVSG